MQSDAREGVSSAVVQYSTGEEGYHVWPCKFPRPEEVSYIDTTCMSHLRKYNSDD